MGLISRVSSRTYRNVNFVKNNNKMVSVKDVNQSDFVTAFAAFLKKSGKCTPPKWSDFAKTATFKQNAPADDDWFYVRTAAIARQFYIKGTVGTGRWPPSTEVPLTEVSDHPTPKVVTDT